MKLKATLAVSAIALLAACGGGSSGVNNAPTTVIKSYPSGYAVITGSLPNANENFVGISADQRTALEVTSETINYTVNDSSTSGRFYYVDRSGTTSSGSQVRVYTWGEDLNLSGSEYVSLSIAYANGVENMLTAGTPVTSIPTGRHTYSGESFVIERTDEGYGTFTLIADFSQSTASLAASVPQNSSNGGQNPAYFFGAENIAINSTNGSFSSENARIGLTGTSGNSASVYGYFAGTGASGVHGIVYENGNGNQYGGAFYGSR